MGPRSATPETSGDLTNGSRPVNVKTGCTCPNQGRPIDGYCYIDPCCRIHYAERGIPIPRPESKKESWAKREKPSRLCYPKMKVAKP